jgi:GNAT superfamily N-acetyltransferase
MTQESVSRISYRRLRRDQINEQVVNDLNVLLPQLAPDTTVVLSCDDLEEMLDEGTIIFVAKDGDKIIATVLLTTQRILVGRKDWIEDVVTDDRYRRRGVATKLMSMAHKVSQARSAKNVNLTSKPTRLAARKMYEEMGYQLRDTGVFRLDL